jgi:hypothetical protein
MTEMVHLQATRITGHTLVAHPGQNGRLPPYDWGNCFSVLCDDGKQYRIVNFILENLEWALNNGLITWPIRIQLVDGVAYMDDVRIPETWYSTRICEVCCPFDKLPIHQQMRNERHWERSGSKNVISFVKEPRWPVE